MVYVVTYSVETLQSSAPSAAGEGSHPVNVDSRKNYGHCSWILIYIPVNRQEDISFPIFTAIASTSIVPTWVEAKVDLYLSLSVGTKSLGRCGTVGKSMLETAARSDSMEGEIDLLYSDTPGKILSASGEPRSLPFCDWPKRAHAIDAWKQGLV